MNEINNPDIFQYLTLSLAPVFVIGIGMLAIKISRNTKKEDDNSKDRKF